MREKLQVKICLIAKDNNKDSLFELQLYVLSFNVTTFVDHDFSRDSTIS